MKTISLIVSLLLFIQLTKAQNLVPNFDFEDLISEPCGFLNSSTEFENSMNTWQVANGGTPDIFLSSIEQACWNFQPNSSYPGPIGLKGSQDPHSGDSFVGLFAFTIDGLDQRDYLQVELNSPMQTGIEYIVEFYVSLADNTEFSVDDLGAYLSTTAISGLDDGPLDYEAQVHFDDFVTDTENWVQISDTIIADENFEFITLGNFNDDANTSTQENPSSAGCVGCYGAYYFVDDISITPLSSTTVIEIDFDPKIKIYPIPFYNFILLESDRELQNVSIRVFDLTGRLHITSQHSSFSEMKIDSKSLPNGYYLIEIEHDKGIERRKILKSN